MSRMSLSSLLSVSAGGEAEVKIVRSVREAEYRERDIVLGRGTNVVASDRGVTERVLVMRCDEVRFTRGGVIAESGAPLGVLATEACRRSLSGLEWAVGIPGSVGGAVVMNAGAFGGETGRLVRRVRVLTERGIADIPSGDLTFSYRGVSGLPSGAILEVELSLVPGDARKIFSAVSENIKRRRASQPSGRSAGSVFLACDGVPAGYHIDRAGLKGLRCGGAHVSDKHANFIIMDEGAKAEDFRALAETVKLKVYTAFGVKLKEEVRYIGRF